MKNWLTSCTAVLLLFSLVSCAQQDLAASSVPGTGRTGDSLVPASQLEEKLTITWMARSFEGGGWPDDHPVIKELNRRFNVDLKIQWVPADLYKEKLNVLAASKEFPDMFLVLHPQFNKWKTQGMFMDVMPYLEQYPYLAAIPEEALRALNPKGKLFGLPFYATQARDTLILREDWLSKLQLQKPRTLDEFYAMAKAFATEDPDGNGKPDTSGFTLYIDDKAKFRDIEFILAGFGLGNEWKKSGGALVPYQTQVNEWKQALAFLNKAYSEGVLDHDFAVRKIGAPTEMFQGGKIGAAMLNPNQLSRTMSSLTMLVPDAAHSAVEPPQGPTGLTGTSHIEMLDKLVIHAGIDSKKQQRILQMLDYFLSPEGSDLIKHGMEGVHYKKLEQARYEKLPAAEKDRQNLINNWIFRPFDPRIQMYKWEDPAHHQYIKDLFAMNKKHLWSNPAEGLESETMTKLGIKLNERFTQTAVKIIMGLEPVDSIEKASTEWLEGGGNQIIDEINLAYHE
jgi:putative aldouronate transport system substrate-binding protein